MKDGYLETPSVICHSCCNTDARVDGHLLSNSHKRFTEQKKRGQSHQRMKFYWGEVPQFPWRQWSVSFVRLTRALLLWTPWGLDKCSKWSPDVPVQMMVLRERSFQAAPVTSVGDCVRNSTHVFAAHVRNSPLLPSDQSEHGIWSQGDSQGITKSKPGGKSTYRKGLQCLVTALPGSCDFYY